MTASSDEVASLDRVLMRLAGTEEADLEKVLSKLIPAVIISLKSPDEGVKKKVLEILGHVNKRVKGQLKIKLPISELLPLASMEPSQADLPPDKAALIRSFALVYIEMSFERATPEQKLDAVPSLAHLIHLRPAQHRSICLRLVVNGLEAAGGLSVNSLISSVAASPDRMTKDGTKLSASELGLYKVLDKWPFLSCSRDTSVLLDHFVKYLLYQPPPSDMKQRVNTPLASANLAQQQQQGGLQSAAAPYLAPGLSPSQVKELEEKDGVTHKSLSARKLGLLGFLAAASPALLITPLKAKDSNDEDSLTLTPLVQSSERLLLPLIVAASDPSADVQSKAEDLLKRLCSTDGLRPPINLEDPKNIDSLMQLFHGSVADESISPQERKQPACLPIKARLMPIFNRSIAAANAFPLTVQTISSCIYGDSNAAGVSTNVRLKSLGMEFAVWVFKHAAEHQLKDMGPKMLNSLLETLGAGETGPLPQDQTSLSLRGFAYQAIGCLASRVPALLSNRVDIARLFFKSLSDEPSGLRSTVSESVSSLSKAFMQQPKTTAAAAASDADATMTEGATEDHQKSLEDLLIESIESSRDAVRACAVQWANRIFPATHALSRYICILAAGDLKIEVREEGLKGLHLHHTTAAKKEKARIKLQDLTSCLRERRPLIFSGSFADTYRSLPLFPKSYLALLHFTKASWTPTGSDDGSRSAYLGLMEGALCRDSTGELVAAALRGILDLALLDLTSFSARYASRLQVLRKYLGHTDAGARFAAAKIFGAVSNTLDDSSISALITELSSGLKSGASALRFEEKEGSIFAIGFILADRSRQHSNQPSFFDEAILTLIDLIGSSVAKGSSSTQAGTSDSQLSTAAAIALGFASLRGRLHLPRSPIAPASLVINEPQSMEIDGATNGQPDAEGGDSILSLLIARLSELMFDHRDLKVAVRAISAAGYLMAGARSIDPSVADQNSNGKAITDKLLETLFKLSTNKAEELQFAAGEAIAFAFGCIPLTADQILLSNFDGLADGFRLLSPSSSPQSQATSGGDSLMADAAKDESDVYGSRARVLSKLFDELIVNPKQEVRSAATVWMVSLLTFCPNAPELLLVLPRIQSSLGGLLSDPNELTQEMASRGVSLVYTRGDEATRKLLVEDLVSVLQGSGAKAAAIKVSADTRVFEEGVLGPAAPPPSSSSSSAAPALGSSSNEGGNLSTYRELCSLATDLGQPDLIYKFMDLAHHQSAVNAKRGAAFGFAAVAKLAGARLDPAHVSTLVPKLYRYQYDPNPKVQDSMVLIWRALIDDPKKTVDAHFDAIMSELIKEMGGKLWRSRQAACGALSDLIQGRRWPELRAHIAKVWTMTLRAVDDIKETVRRQALALARSVRGISLRLMDPQQSSVKECIEAVGQILPLLLGEQGLGSSVTEVRILSLDTIAKTVQASHPPSLKPHLPLLIQCMLEGLSNLEDMRLNYVEQHAERLGLDQEKLESARGDTLDICTRYNDAQSLEAIVPVLLANIKRGVGLNTKVGTARFLRSLLSKADRDDVKPHAPSLIRTLMASAKNERSPVIRKAYASAAAQVCKYATDKRLEKVVEEACQMYSDADADGDSKYVGGLILYELLKALPDTFSSIAAPLALPLAFGAKMDLEEGNKEVAEIWAKVWEEGVSSEAAAIRLHAPNIVKVLVEGLTGASWSRKRSCAQAVAQLCKTRGVEDVLKPHLESLFAPLMAELTTPRLWEGKESILAALGAICPVLKSLALNLPESGSMTLEIIRASFSSAVNQKKALFRSAALACLLAALESLDPLNPVPQQAAIFDQISPALMEACIAHSTVKPEPVKAKGEDAGDEESAPSPLPLVESLKCLSLAFTNCSSLLSDHDLGENEIKMKNVLLGILGMPGITWQQSVAASQSASAIIEACSKHQVSSAVTVTREWSLWLVPPLLNTSRASNVHQARTVGLASVKGIVEVTMKIGKVDDWGSVGQDLEAWVSDEKNSEIKDMLTTIRTLL